MIASIGQGGKRWLDGRCSSQCVCLLGFPILGRSQTQKLQMVGVRLADEEAMISYTGLSM